MKCKKPPVTLRGTHSSSRLAGEAHELAQQPGELAQGAEAFGDPHVREADLLHEVHGTVDLILVLRAFLPRVDGQRRESPMRLMQIITLKVQTK